jgi:hypothetical protein
MVAVPGTNEVLISYDRLGNGWGALKKGQASAVIVMKLSVERGAQTRGCSQKLPKAGRRARELDSQ